MAQILTRFVQAATLRRDAFLWMYFEGQATGDAVMLVAITALVLPAANYGDLDLNIYVGAVIGSLFAWLIVAGLVWAAAKFIFDGHGEYAGVLRVVGFAFPTLLFLLVTIPVLNGLLGVAVGSLWFVAVIAAGLQVVMEMQQDRAWGAALVGFAGWLILQQIGFGRLLL